eukprot:8783561-Lingulodinium_polyedra.AAC.1
MVAQFGREEQRLSQVWESVKRGETKHADEGAALCALYQECQAMPARIPPSPRMTSPLFSTPQPN